MDKPPAREMPRDVWVELRTSTDRIEGLVRLPAQSKARRISDLLKVADRGESGVIHLMNVTVYDQATNAVKFRKRSLGVNKEMVIYASPLGAEEPALKKVFDIPAVGMSAN